MNPALGAPVPAPRPALPTRTDLPSAPRELSVRVPEELAGRYEVIREIDHGGQALVLEAKDRDSGERVAIKYYVQVLRADSYRHSPGASVELDHPGLVRTIEAGQYGEHWWEVMEFCGGGTLADVITAHPDGAPPSLVRAMVEQVTAALAYLHDRGVVHRDLKPENVLLREGPELSIALGDLGTAVRGAGNRSVAVRSAWVSAGYAPADAGHVSPPLDYWALGIMTAELASGRHPLWLEEITDPLAPRAEDIAAFLRDHEVPLDQVTDPRLRLLAEGLLTRDRSRRWGAGQVRAWLAGESPEVAPRKAASFEDVRVSFAFNGESYSNPQRLGLDMAAHWRPAMRLIAGRGFDDLVRWLLPTPQNEIVTQIREQHRAGAMPAATALVRVLLALNPDGPYTFGEAQAIITPAGLLDLARAAIGGDTAALRTTGELFDSGALAAFPPWPQEVVPATLQARWQQAVTLTCDEIERAGKEIEKDIEGIERGFRRLGRDVTIPDGAHAPEVTAELRHEIAAHLLAALLSPQYAIELGQAADRAATDQAQSRPWFRRLAARLGMP